jgi:sugar O-acyltransferase (sialic acid O-acetyltransferase NeuD family)
MENPVIILGAGTLGIAAMEAFESNHVLLYGFLDDDPAKHGNEIGTLSVLGACDDDGFLKLVGKKCDVFVAQSNQKERKHLAELILERRKVMPVNAIHARSYLSPYAGIGHGNFFGPGVVVHPFATIGNFSVLHANVQAEANVKVGNFCSIGTGSLVGEGVTIHDGAFIGRGVSILEGITIGKNASIGAGSVVISSVPSGKTYFGNPAVEIAR